MTPDDELTPTSELAPPPPPLLSALPTPTAPPPPVPRSVEHAEAPSLPTPSVQQPAATARPAPPSQHAATPVAPSVPTAPAQPATTAPTASLVPTLPSIPAPAPTPQPIPPVQSNFDVTERQHTNFATQHSPHVVQRQGFFSPSGSKLRGVVLFALVVVAAGVFGNKYLESRQDRWDPRVADIATFVEQERGLLFDHTVDVQFLSEANFVRIFDTSGYEIDDEASAEWAAYSQLYNAAGLASNVDLLASGSDVAAVSSLGFYEPTEDRIYIRGTTMTPAVSAVVAHELTHALQAQHFDLTLGGPDDLAHRSIIEADALLVESQFVLTLPAADQSAANLDNALTDEAAASLDEAPSMLVDQQYAPYVLGPILVDEVFRADGNPGVDELLRIPPTEEILIDPSLHATGQVEVEPGVEVPAGAVVIEEPRHLSMFDTLAMLDAWLPWTQARGAFDGWAGGGYVSYELSTSDPTVCFAVSAAFDESPDAFVGAVEAWAAASQSTAQPAVVDGRVVFEACDRGIAAPEPPTQIVSLLESVSIEHSAVTSLGPDAGSAAVAAMRCTARALIDDPTTASLLLQPVLTADQELTFDQARQAAVAACESRAG